MNTVVKQNLGRFENYLLNNWENLQALSKYGENNTTFKTMNMSPFFVNYHYDACLSSDQVSIICDEDQHGKMVAQPLRNITDPVRNKILRAQNKQKEAADRFQLPALDVQTRQSV